MPVVRIDPVSPDPAIINDAARRIREGELVAFPTETVYGLGANGFDAIALRDLYAAKGRPAWNPVILHVPDAASAKRLTRTWPESARQLSNAFWPGPLTIVLPKSNLVPDEATAGLDAVGVRVPEHPVALALIRAADVPIAAPSANRFTQVSPTTAQHVVDSLGDRVALVLDGGPCAVGIESTVVDCTGDTVVILRPGIIGRDLLEAALREAGIAVEVAKRRAVDHDADTQVDAPRSPGMSDRHYAPRAEVWLFAPESTNEIVQALAERKRTAPETSGRVIGLLRRVLLPEGACEVIHMPEDHRHYAREMYAALHEADARKASLVVIELPPLDPEWDGVRDRLTRAAR